jgi:hypothetical protein
METKCGLMFGHMSFIFPRSHSFSYTNYSVRWDFPVPGGGRRPFAPEATSGRRLWWCEQSLTSDVFFQFAKQWQSEVGKSILYGVSGTRCQWQVSRGEWVVWTILGPALSCSGSTPLVSRPGLWRRVASLRPIHSIRHVSVPSRNVTVQ